MTDIPDLADPALYADADGLDVLARLQRAAPLCWVDSRLVPGFWAITGHPEAMALYLDRNSFTSAAGMQVGQNEGAALAASGRMLIVTDEPRHRVMRGIIGPLLRSQEVERLRERMEALIGSVLDELLDVPSFDFVQDVAAILPSFAICELLGIPGEDAPRIVGLTRTAFGSTTGSRAISDVEKTAANAELFDYFSHLLWRRRAAPGDDAVSQMVVRSKDGEHLGDDEIILNIHGLITGGNETTRHASSGAVLAFADAPRAWRRLREDPSLVRTAVEEVLRWSAPSLNVMRTCTRATELCGIRINAGERVSVWTPVVNRDPRAFDAPYAFAIERDPNDHLTFGLGRHLCVGASLARLELAVLLRALARRVAGFERAGPVKRLNSNLMWGVDSVPIRLVAA